MGGPWTVVEPPEGTYQADPFPYKRDGKQYMFIEDYDYKVGKLSYYEINNGKADNLTTIIKEGYHFSYPFIFDYDGETWIIPESSRNGTIELWKCDEFPNKWVKIKTLLNVRGNDTTLFEKDGKVYLFTNVGDDNNVTIYYSDTLFGEWKLHSNSNHQWSRPAGKMFYYEGKLIRPTQDCSKCYGHALILKEVTLTPNKYTEKVFKRIEPDWMPNLIGTHTFNFDNDYVYIDGKVQVP